jgi:hypothetical protein
MDSFNFSSGFSTPSYNVNSWGSVTNNMGQSIGNVDRYGSFRSNLTPWYSNNVDSYGTISSGFNGNGTQFGKINGYDSYLSTQRLRDSMDYLNKKDYDDSYLGRFKKSREPEFIIPKYEPIIPYKEPKILFNSPASTPLFTDFSKKKKSSWEDDLNWKYKF